MALFSDNHANPPNHKYNPIRRKSSAKRKFYKGHRSLSREKMMSSKRYTREGKNFHLGLHTCKSRAGLSTPLLLCSLGSIDVEPTAEATAVFRFYEEHLLPCILQGNPRNSDWYLELRSRTQLFSREMLTPVISGDSLVGLLPFYWLSASAASTVLKYGTAKA